MPAATYSPTTEAAVPSALRGLTSGFGMGPGVTPSREPPARSGRLYEKEVGDRAVRSASRAWEGLPVFEEVDQASRPISTARLRRLPALHLPPIHAVVSCGPSGTLRCGRSHLGGGFPLRCFQRLSRPDVATQRCPWRDSWYTSGQSTPVLSY